jgi:hypothetical protein
MTESRLSQNDGHLLYLCHEIGGKLTLHEYSTESEETDDVAPSLILNKVYLNFRCVCFFFKDSLRV